MKANEISTIKNIIQVNLDAADGLRMAADSINDSMMQGFLTRCARARRKYARRLYLTLSKEDAMQWGERLETGITSMWNQLKSATYKFYPAAILKECSQAEEYALKVYDDALSHNLPASLRDLLSSQKNVLNERYKELNSMVSQLEQWASGYPASSSKSV